MPDSRCCAHREVAGGGLPVRMWGRAPGRSRAALVLGVREGAGGTRSEGFREGAGLSQDGLGSVRAAGTGSPGRDQCAQRQGGGTVQRRTWRGCECRGRRWQLSLPVLPLSTTAGRKGEAFTFVRSLGKKSGCGNPRLHSSGCELDPSLGPCCGGLRTGKSLVAA